MVNKQFDLVGESYFLALVVTDEGETEPFLRSQLHLTKELLLLECGPQGLANSGIVPLPSRRISAIIGTMTRLCSTRQSFLVQSTEELLSHSINTNVNDSIAAILGQQIESVPNVQNAILCVGTKVVSIFKKSQLQRLSTQDLFLLTILCTSHFDPYHLPKQAAKGTVDETLATPERPLEITAQILSIGETYRLIEFAEVLESAGIEGIKAKSTGVDAAGPIIRALKILLIHEARHDGVVNEEFDAPLTKTLQKIQQEFSIEPADGQICLPTLKAIVRHIIEPSLPQEEERVIPSSEDTGSSRNIPKVDSVANFSTLSFPQTSELDEAILALRYCVDDRPKITYEEMHSKRVYQTCYLSSSKYRPGTLYFARFLGRITLILLSVSPNESAQERLAMEKIENGVQDELANKYSSYLLSMETSYTMVAYIHLLPGLVHFIFVERTTNRFIAPEITELGGDVTAAQIKKHVWHLCYQSTEFLSRGALEMVQQNGPFQYSYKLIFEDAYGNVVQPREQRNFEIKTPVTREFYKKLTASLFPGQVIRCHELFCLYVNSMSLKMIQKHNDTLHAMLTKRS